MRRKPTVFAVTSDTQIVSLLQKALDGTDMILTEAQNADRAPNQAKLLVPDLIVVDDKLEGPDWFTVYKRLNEELSFTFVPVLLLVDPSDAEAALAKMESSLIDILIKPVNPSELRSRLRAMQQVKNIHDQLDIEKHVLQQKLDEERKIREQLTSINEELKRLSTTDGLTGLANYRYMRNWLTTEYEIATRYKLQLSAIMLDLDNFKDVNDRFGHPFGDYVLKTIASLIQERSRRADFTARYGGDEFVIILPNTDGTAAVNLAQRVHKAVEKHLFDDGQHKCNITISLGISSYPADGVQSAEMLIDFADRALYAAKSRGRNRIISWNEAR